MTQARTPDKPSGNRASIDRRERRYEQLQITVRRWQLRFEKADRTAARAVKTLAKLERQRRRMEKALAQARAEAADDLVETAAESKRILSESCDAIVSAMVQDESFEQAAAKDDGVPQFLKDAAVDRNRKLQAMADPKTKEKKAQRREVEKQHRDAELTGKRRKMPVTGKAALDALRGS